MRKKQKSYILVYDNVLIEYEKGCGKRKLAISIAKFWSFYDFCLLYSS